jgi:glycosyltransferase involved in cell wall biosynthesis
MAAADLIIMPSLSEAFGRILIEAMACEKPVVATNVGGIPEIVEDGKTGLLVPPADEKSIADAAIKLLSDKPLADSLAAAGRESIEKNFNILDQVQKIEGIIDECLE